MDRAGPELTTFNFICQPLSYWVTTDCNLGSSALFPSNSIVLHCISRYSSGAKAFSQIHAKSLSIQVDGFQIKKEFWQSTKTQPPSKTDSNFRKGSSTSRVDHVGKGSYKPIRR